MVTITHQARRLIAMPSADELVELFKISAAAFPKLVRRYSTSSAPERSSFYVGFVRCFECISQWHRLTEAEIDLTLGKTRAETWRMEVAGWPPDAGGSDLATLSNFMLAVAAAGDVVFTDPAAYPHCGLSHDSSARAPTPAWQSVLSSRQTRAPFKPVGSPVRPQLSIEMNLVEHLR